MTTYDVKPLHAIKMRYLGPTDMVGARVKLISLRFNKDSVTLPRDYERSPYEQVARWLKSNGYSLVAQAENPDGHLFLVDEFKPLRSS